MTVEEPSEGNNMESFTTTNQSELSYLVVYSFKNFPGHVAIFDGSKYYSFGGKLSFGIETQENGADELAKFDAKTYGDAKKIIIPIPPHIAFQKRRDEIQAEMEQKWTPKRYHYTARNCANMVEDYLVQAFKAPDNISTHENTSPTHKKTIFALLPREVKAQAFEMGTHHFNDQLSSELKQSLTSNQELNRKTFLTSFKKFLLLNPALCDAKNSPLPDNIKKLILLNDTPIAELDAKKLNELFCQIKLELAKTHYTEGNTPANIQSFYDAWFSLAVTIDHPNTMERILTAEIEIEALQQKLLKELEILKITTEKIGNELIKIDKDDKYKSAMEFTIKNLEADIRSLGSKSVDIELMQRRILVMQNNNASALQKLQQNNTWLRETGAQQAILAEMTHSCHGISSFLTTLASPVIFEELEAPTPSVASPRKHASTTNIITVVGHGLHAVNVEDKKENNKQNAAGVATLKPLLKSSKNNESPADDTVQKQFRGT
jgi:hypothetical protein